MSVAWPQGGTSMPDTTKEADLAAIKARIEINYAVANHPMFAGNPIVIAALANAKANDAAFFAALAEVEADRSFFRAWSTRRHFLQACAAADKAHAALRASIEIAEAETGTKPSFTQANNADLAVARKNELTGETSVETLITCALAYAKKGQFDLAIANCDEAIRLDPQYAPAFCNRGAFYCQKSDGDHAIADFDQAIRLDPKEATAFYNRGNLYKKKGDYNRAITDYNEAIQLDPHYGSHLWIAVGPIKRKASTTALSRISTRRLSSIQQMHFSSPCAAQRTGRKTK